MRGLTGRVVIVTGAGGGIGGATARRFAEEGASVAVLDRDGDSGQATTDAIVAAGGRSLAVACDITELEVVRASIGSVGRSG